MMNCYEQTSGEAPDTISVHFVTPIEITITHIVK